MTQDEPERVEDESLIQRLWDVGMHDWRLSHLAHTSDTASRAAHEIERLRSLLSVSEKRAEELHQHWRADIEKLHRVISERDSSQASLLRAEAETIERCAKVADDWLTSFGGVEIRHVAARDYAADAVRDVAEAIRSTAPSPHVHLRLAALVEALEQIAGQHKLSELSEAGEDCEGDFEGAYDTIIDVARTALSPHKET